MGQGLLQGGYEEDKPKQLKAQAERIYDAWPKGFKKAKGAAVPSIMRVLSAGEVTYEVLMDAVKRYGKTLKGVAKADRRYQPYPATWINQTQWLEWVDSEPEEERNPYL